MAQPVNKWVQSFFWPLSVLPSFQHIPKHSADDYVGRTSPILGTAIAFWLCAIAVVLIWGIANDMFLGDATWRGIDTALGVLTLFLLVIYVAGFWMFASREEDYPN